MEIPSGIWTGTGNTSCGPYYVLPPKQVRRTKNSSLILPRVIAQIAAIKGVPAGEVERITAENAIRLFALPGFEKL